MIREEPEKPIVVGIGLLARDGRYLIRQRPPGSAMAGVWEFPGGKCEPGETPEQATVRECHEETGLATIAGRLRRRLVHRYPHAWVELFYFDCTTADPAAEPRPETGFRWVEAQELLTLTFPGANEPILEELSNEARRTTDPT